MKILKYLAITILCLLLSSCAAKYISGGYYFLDQNQKSYYGNDAQKLFILLSDKFAYDKQEFNCEKISEKDKRLLADFNLKPKHLLFSYHSSSGRESIAFLENGNPNKFKSYKKLDAENLDIYYKTKITKRNIYRENIYPFRNKYIHVLEKSPIFFDRKKDSTSVHKAKIFPLILNKKPLE